MANISEGTYVVEGLKINVDALKVFSSLLPSTALNIVEWAEDIVVHLPVGPVVVPNGISHFIYGVAYSGQPQ